MDIKLEPIEVAIAELLRMEMARHNITQSSIAKETGLALRTINRYVNAERSMKVSDLAKICDVIGVSASALLDTAEKSIE